MLDVEIAVSYLFLFILAILILFDRTGMLSISLLAVICHELGHIIALKRQNHSFTSVVLSIATVKVTTAGILNYKKSVFVAIAGPVVNMFLSFFVLVPVDLLQYFGAANIIMFVFNMLPIKGLDGGDALKGLLIYLNLKKAQFLCNIVSLVSTAVVIILGGLLFIATKENPTLLLVGIYLLILSFNKI